MNKDNFLVLTNSSIQNFCPYDYPSESDCCCNSAVRCNVLLVWGNLTLFLDFWKSPVACMEWLMHADWKWLIVRFFGYYHYYYCYYSLFFSHYFLSDLSFFGGMKHNYTLQFWPQIIWSLAKEDRQCLYIFSSTFPPFSFSSVLLYPVLFQLLTKVDKVFCCGTKSPCRQ